MPPSRSPLPLEVPAPVSRDEAHRIRETIRRFYGETAVVRNYGPDPRRLLLHVEMDIEPRTVRDECLGILLCEISRDQVSLAETRRGRRIGGEAKIAYRQGEIL